MDANGLKFWLLAEERHWLLPGAPPALEYDSRRRSLRLARQRRDLQQLTENRSQAEGRIERVPQCRDLHGNRAWFDAGLRRILAAGVCDPPQEIYRLDAPGALTDLAVDDDGVLYLAVNGAVILHDLRERWDDATVGAPGFTAWRLAAAAGGGVWVLDREHRLLARLSGRPLPDTAVKPYLPQVVRPCAENADPPRLVMLDRAVWPETETPVGLACSLAGELAVLSWAADREAVLRQLSGELTFSDPVTLIGSRFPYSLAWVAPGRVGVLVCGVDSGAGEPKSEARVYPAGMDSGQQYPSGDLYPLKKDYDFGPFLHGLDYPPHYPATGGSHALHRLSFPFFTRQGEAANNTLFAPLDSGAADTVWHRLYVEAAIPPVCGVRLFLAAANEVREPADIADTDWFEHRFGDSLRQGGASDVPHGCRLPLASELPCHPGLSPCSREGGRNGLFTALIQRPGRRVRTLRGRYLHVRAELTGPGNATPELFAVRAYGGRFSYVEHYLPRLYWERLFAPEADDRGPATEADFFERFINNFEGTLTVIEDRVAASDLVTRPRSTPAAALPWLASWVGLDFEPALPEARQRAWLENAAELARWHGTLRGMRLALEIATNGGVSGGEIVVLEDFRLRRTFATILGAQLDDADDPLTLGGMETGNSLVGDTLFLGEETRREFLALFSAELAVSAAEEAAIDAFFDRLAFRVTILVHQNVTPQDLGLILRVAEREAPAHVLLRVLPTSAPLLAGITALVGVDTYLATRLRPRPARVNRSAIGRGDYVMGPATLDPRLEGIGGAQPAAAGPPPVARANDIVVAFGQEFTVDGSASTAAEGRTLTAFHWTLLNGGNT
jgi:phage tail-like protein